MLLAIGITGASLGYTVAAYGYLLARRNPQTFAYLLGLSNAGTMSLTADTSSGSSGGSRSSSGRYAATPNPVRPNPSGALR